jgi:hypothetical protein
VSDVDLLDGEYAAPGVRQLSAVDLAGALDQMDVAVDALAEVERLVGAGLAGTLTGWKLGEVTVGVKEVRGQIDRLWRVISDREVGR